MSGNETREERRAKAKLIMAESVAKNPGNPSPITPKGRICKNGHAAFVGVACYECAKAERLRYYAKHREKVRERSRLYYQNMDPVKYADWMARKAGYEKKRREKSEGKKQRTKSLTKAEVESIKAQARETARKALARLDATQSEPVRDLSHGAKYSNPDHNGIMRRV
jgi:hypothetical protein